MAAGFSGDKLIQVLSTCSRSCLRCMLDNRDCLKLSPPRSNVLSLKLDTSSLGAMTSGDFKNGDSIFVVTIEALVSILRIGEAEISNFTLL